MEISSWYEIIGYAASLLIALSLMMKSILRLRVINLIGSLFFTIYGLVIQAYPVAAVNFFIVLIDLYYLFEMRSAKEFFRLLRVQHDSEYLSAFLQFYHEDIQKFQPGFAWQPSAHLQAYFVLRNMVPAGLVIAEARGADELFVLLDYAIPGYRDFKMGRFVFQDQSETLKGQGVRTVYAQPGSAVHAQYLRRMGFAPQQTPGGEEVYRLTL